MMILAFDTSTSHGGLAVVRNGQTLAVETWEREKSHSELITAKIESTLNILKIQAKDLTAVAVGHGPGSFTGIRVAVNAARGLSFALKIPIYAFDTSEILVNGVSRRDLPVLTLINAHKNLVFASTFTSSHATDWRRTTPLSLLSLKVLQDEIKHPHLCVGNAYSAYVAHFPAQLKSNLVRDSSQSDFPNPAVLAHQVWQRHSSLSPLDWNQLQALYIRASGAEEKIRES